MDIDWIVTLWSALVVLVATTEHGITGFGPTAVAGGRQDPADLDFRSETCLTGVAIWRADNPIQTDVGTTPLQEGDALLLYGPGWWRSLWQLWQCSSFGIEKMQRR